MAQIYGNWKANIFIFIFLQPVEATDDAFWDQFWADTTTTVQDVFALVPAAEIRAVREESPSNLATLCYKVHTVGTVKNASVSCKLEYEMGWDCRRTSLSLRVHRGIMLLWNAAGLVCCWTQLSVSKALPQALRCRHKWVNSPSYPSASCLLVPASVWSCLSENKTDMLRYLQPT